ncbi:hypothetical protein PUND_b0451 [Pseudoalteromonas undina]|mgnify:CR=1 FL=1|uniref:Phage protein n=1 Tax=Pseudoalteromonas undina TaxID=43660 RepID=A0ABN0NIA2_9GAMM|nr:hypothetical protein [Pseudoalteromonas undina]KAF7763116.1 hypothetical protein PUND_b0451 [Pseudoalteromonas undina]|tara:strand:- start:409 stop:738 length:330 start_codon:yes stop_codon:yes gene_type:complete
MSTLDHLTNWDIELVKKVVDHLNEFGIVSDEDGYDFPSTWIERWSDACTDYLKIHGYKGGPLSDIGEFFSGYGAVYGLYNTTGISYKSAGEYITKLATSNMQHASQSDD